jgi:hypothetical protein
MTTIPPETNLEPNGHTETVRGYLNTMRTMVEQIPGYAEGSLADRRKLNFSANLTDEFLEEMATALEAGEPKDPEALALARALRESIVFSQAHQSLVLDLDRKKAGVQFAIARNRSEVGKLALQGYKVAKVIDALADRGVPIPNVAHVASLRRAFRRRKTKTEPTPPATPVVEPPKTGGGS